MAAFSAVDLSESAVVDPAHLGDIEGALGRVRVREIGPRRSLRGRLLALAAVTGPGLIVMLANNDAGSIATFAQTGEEYGTRLLWVLFVLLPILCVNQEMAARLGAVSGVGHARLILARFGRFWSSLALGDLILLNGLTLITEFVGVRLAAGVLGLPVRPTVLVAAAVLLLVTSTGSFRKWERMMFALVAVDVAVVPLALVGGRHAAVHGLLAPAVGATGPDAVLILIALAGTTIAPWQLFFQQSSVVDKRITPRWLGYERVDLVIGAVLMVLSAAVVMTVAAAAFSGGSLPGHVHDAGQVAVAAGSRLGGAARALFAVLLLDGALLGGMTVTLSAAYACSEVTGARHSLHREPRDAPFFYALIGGMIVAAAAVALLPWVTPATLTVMVQVLAAVLLPSATIFLLLLSNDTQVLGPWVNPPWLNWLGATVVAALLLLSMLLVCTSLLPGVALLPLALVLAVLTLAGLLVTGASTGWGRRAWARAEYLDTARAEVRVLGAGDVVVLPRRSQRLSRLAARRRAWRTPPLEELARPPATRGRVLAMLALRAYLLVAVCVVVLRGILPILGH